MAKRLKANQKIVTRELTFKINQEQRLAFGQQLEVGLDQVDDLKQDAKDSASRYKNLIATEALEINRIRRILRDGTIDKVTECIEERDYNKLRVKYLVNGVTIEERDMEQHERQTEMPVDQKTFNPPRQKKKSTKEREVGDVISMETNKKTKKSAVDSTATN